MPADDISIATRYRSLGRRPAIVIVAAMLLTMILGVWRGGEGKALSGDSNAGSGIGDTTVLCLIAQRVHAGQSYYDAAAAELRANGYGMRSVFNWRQPLYAWVLGALPNLTWGRVLLGVLGTAALLLAMRPFLHDGAYLITLLNVWLLSGACFFCFTAWGIGAVEAWAGILILLSVFAYADRLLFLGVFLGLLALFFRELAAPYVIVCVALALVARRWREIAAWAVGLLLYAGYFSYHIVHVHRVMRAMDRGYATGWVYFGGLHFIVDTVAQNELLLSLPLWVSGIFLPLSLVGLFGMRGELGTRAALCVALYLLMFAVIGKPFNDYWGQLDAPLLAFGLPWLIPAAADLWRELRGPPNARDARPSAAIVD